MKNNQDPKLNHMGQIADESQDVWARGEGMKTSIDNNGCEPCLLNAELTEASAYYYPNKGEPKVFLCEHHAIKINKMLYTVFEIGPPFSHGGKRPGAGRKPTATGSNLPVYCGRLEEDERAAIMQLTPQARKLALLSMVKKERTDRS